MQPKANRREGRARRRSHWAKRFCFAILGATLLLCTLTTQASNPNFRLCFRPALNVPGPDFLQPPVVDGIINNDFGWTDGWRYVFNSGTPTNDVVVQAIRTSTDLYMSFEINEMHMDADYDDQDVIVLTLDPDGTAANQRRLHIFPVFQGSGAAGSGDPRDVEYWTNSSTWNATAAAAPPAGTLIKVTHSGVAPNVSYFVEIKLPRAAYGIPAAGDFGLYFNVMRVLGPNVNEKFWPTTASPIGIFVTNTPPASDWGTASVSGACNGVSITPPDITTNQSPPSKIALTGPNIFSAVVHNNTIDAAGNPAPANQVNATFRIANFGLPSAMSWNNVPAPGNPTGPQNIPAGGNPTFSTGAWTLTPGQQATYNTPATSHQCILVELDSTAANTVFVNKSAWTNMEFGPASTFERVAEVSGKGYGRPPGGAPNHVFDIVVTTSVDEVSQRNQNTYSMAQAALKTSNQRIAQMTWLAHGYRHTGNYVEIQKKRYRIVDHVGSYGFFIFHAIPEGGDIKAINWDSRLSGSGIRPQGRNKNMYRLDVPVDGAALINTVITATDKDTKPPKKRKCGEARSFTGGIVMLAGVFLTGFTLYRPRRRKGRAR